VLWIRQIAIRVCIEWDSGNLLCVPPWREEAVRGKLKRKWFVGHFVCFGVTQMWSSSHSSSSSSNESANFTFAVKQAGISGSARAVMLRNLSLRRTWG
jgi:hypothetical protein